MEANPRRPAKAKPRKEAEEELGMRQLSETEISELASRTGVRKIAVENFLSTMGEDEDDARYNLIEDARSYKWNMATINAIMRGISIACGRGNRN